MVQYGDKYAFARYWLQKQGMKIFSGKNQILAPVDEKMFSHLNFNISPYFEVGGEYVEEEREIRLISDYQELRRKGIVIIVRPVGGIGTFRGQRVEYRLARESSSSNIMENIPPQHKLYYDTRNNAYKLSGKNVLKKGWFNPNKSFHHIRKFKFNKVGIYDEETVKKAAADIYRSWSNEPEVEESIKIPVNHLPIMFSDDNKLICIRENINEPRGIIAGESEFGKSYFMNALGGRAYYLMQKRVCYLNDIQRECSAMTLTWEEDSWQYKTLSRLGETSLPMPLVFLSPNTNTVEDVPCEEDGVGFKISFPFKKMIDNYLAYLKGKKEWDLGDSGKYFRNLKETIMQCESFEEVETEISSLSKEQLPEKSALKITAVMEDIFKQNILDISTGISADWRIERHELEKENYNNPFISCIKSKLVPVFVTDDISTKDYFPQWFKYIGESIFDAQARDKELVSNEIQTWLLIDEVTSIASKTHQTVASDIIKLFYARGRAKRIGTFVATQNYHNLFSEIRQNSTYCFAFKQKSEEASLIAKDFFLEKSEKKALESLPVYKMMVKSTLKNGLVEIDTDGNIKEKQGPYFGYSLHPLSAHKAPKKVSAA